MTGNSIFKNVFEGESVENFMAAFVLSPEERALLEKQNPGADYSAYPDNIEKVKSDIKAIWQQDGFVTPAELQAKLMAKYIPDADPTVLKFLHDIELSRNTPDAVTGYIQKEHAYVATGLAHLYALETGVKTTMIEVDFSNMGGTNDYFRALLAKERNCSIDDVPAREARNMTDQAVLLLCRGLVADLQATLPEGAKIVPIRTGGDEIRLIVEGVPASQDTPALTDILHAGIEKRVASMGLQDHPHLKDPDNPVRNGFGAALALQDMGGIVRTNTLIQELDSRISQAKTDMGLLRLGHFDRELSEIEWQAKVDNGAVKVPAGQNAASFIEERVTQDEIAATQAARTLRHMNPAHNSALVQGSEGFKQYSVSEEKQHGGVSAFDHIALPSELSHASLMAKARNDNLAPMASLHARRLESVRNSFEEQGVNISAAHWRMIDKSLAGLNAVDPAAEVMMPQIMAPTIAAWAVDREAFKSQFDPNDTAVKSACKQAGIKPDDIGNPQGMVVSFHNLAGLNSALGHHYTDVVLRHMVTGVIGKALEEAGIPMKMPEPVLIAHEGGANFTLAVAPGWKDDAGNPVFISEKTMQKVQEGIAKHTAALNKTNVANFLETHGIEMTDNLRNYLNREEIGTFADIRDPKLRTMEVGDHKITGLANGLGVVTAAGSIAIPANDARAGSYVFIDSLRQSAEQQMTSFRQAALTHGYMEHVFAEKQAVTTRFGKTGPASMVQAVFDALPDREQPGMPPEVQALVQLRQMAGEQPAQKVMPLFEQQYNNMLANGSLVEVGNWIRHAKPPEVAAPAIEQAVQAKAAPRVVSGPRKGMT